MSPIRTASCFMDAIARLKRINRWPLMFNTRHENVQEHSHQVVVIAHALALISNRLFDDRLDANRIGMMAAFHDAPEVLTGDMPTPVKYFSNALREEFKIAESVAEDSLLEMLPEFLREDYRGLLKSEVIPHREASIIKAADVLSGYFKCVEEGKTGNKEFQHAEERLLQRIKTLEAAMPEVAYFMETFAPAFKQSLDYNLKQREAP